MSRHWRPLLALSVCAVLSACGVAGSGLSTSPGTGGTGMMGTGGQGGDNMTPDAADSRTGVDTTMPDHPPADTAVSPDVNVVDRAPDNQPDTTTAPDVVPDSGVTPNQVACGMTSCDLTTHYCCASSATSGTCVRNQNSCSNGALFRRCDGAEDCGDGSVCCARAEGNNGYRSACLRPGDCLANGGSTVCRSTDECLSAQRTCMAFPNLGISMCRR